MEDEVEVILSLGECECSKCHIFLAEESGFMLKSCLHPFCRTCLTEAILESPDNQVMCPYSGEDEVDGLDGQGAAAVIQDRCILNGFLTHKEINIILSAEDKQIYLGKSGRRVLEDFTAVAANTRSKTANVQNTKPAPTKTPTRKTEKLNNLENGIEELNNSGYHIVLTDTVSACTYCTDKLPAGSGISLLTCHHIFCRVCLEDAIRATMIVRVNCPMHDCDGYLLDREIKQIASEKEFELYLKKCFQAAETEMANIFHCKTKDCPGLCEVDENSRVFLCPRCNQRNCLACKAIHEDVSCEEFRKILAKGYSLAQAMEIAKNEGNTGFHQVLNYVSEPGPELSRSLPGTSGALKERNSSTYHSITQKIEASHLLPSTKEFSCVICLDDIKPGEGIILQECLHLFCRACIVNHITHSEDADIKCPFRDGNGPCNSLIAPREIKALLTPKVHDEYLGRSIKLAELTTVNSFHCLTPDCPGWCEVEGNANFFNCPVCERENCMGCKAFHETSTCEQYKQQIEDDKNRAVQLENERIGEAAVLASIQTQEFQRCPRCNSVCHKIDGCAHVTCAACKTPFNWR